MDRNHKKMTQNQQKPQQTPQQKLLEHYRLTREEYQRIEKSLGHTPSRLELALFSALWSEHCSYKSSAVHLKKLFFDSPRVLNSLGENAGVVDLGQGERVAFKVESHNHPSRITPYHGAATGVGGILRDVFIMNARPVALADYLCFGDLSHAPTADLLDGVVRGIGGYGNSIGIPVLTGQTEFHPSYNENIVVNALALGYFGPNDKVVSSQARGHGNLLVYAGARTGKDGIHGASMASESFGDVGRVEDKKTCVQIGDPFYGKLLMEACLESMRKNLVVAGQDMGAAGLSSSSFEMISKGGLGMRLYLDRVPLRDTSMTAEEILLSESQERVLLVVEPDKFKELESIFIKWGLPVAVVGEVKSAREVELFWKEKLLLKIDPSCLENAPRYQRPYRPWRAGNRVADVGKTKPVFQDEPGKMLLSLLQGERGGDRGFIYRQYDQRVGARTVGDCSFPVGVFRLPCSGRALALCMGGRPHIMRMDSLQGGMDAVLEPALQLALRGFTPLALTDGLNFASPEREEVMSSFVACVEGMARASRALETPIVSGNVSFYNETQGVGISPTPVTGMVGIKEGLSVPLASLPVGGGGGVNGVNGVGGVSQEKLFVYLVSAHQVFCSGMVSEGDGSAVMFYGALDPDLCRGFMEKIKALERAWPRAVRLVGRFGLAYTLARMMMEGQSACVGGAGVAVGSGVESAEDSASLAMGGFSIKTDYDPFQERLYEAVVVLTERDAKVWERAFGATSGASSPGFKMEKIGIVTKKPILSFNKNICLQKSDLQTAFQTNLSF